MEGGEELQWHQLKHNQLMSPKGPHFCAHSTAKTNDKSTSSGRMACIGISDVVTASVYSGPWILRPLRSKTTCLIRPLLNAPMGFTFILTCVERPPVIPSQRPPCLVKSNTKLPVLKDHFHIWTVAKRFSHKCHVIYT